MKQIARIFILWAVSVSAQQIAPADIRAAEVRWSREIPEQLRELVVNDVRDLEDHQRLLETLTDEAEGSSLNFLSQPTQVGRKVRYVAQRYLDNIPTMEYVSVEVDAESKTIQRISKGNSYRYKREKNPSISQEKAIEIVLTETRNADEADSFRIEGGNHNVELIYVLESAETREQMKHRLWWRVWVERDGPPLENLDVGEPFATHQFWFVDPEGKTRSYGVPRSKKLEQL